jgi:hypothetical protein
MKFLWSRVKKEAGKQSKSRVEKEAESGSGGAESGQQVETRKKGKAVASRKEEEKVGQEGKVGHDKRARSESTAEGSRGTSGTRKSKHAVVKGEEDGGQGAGVGTVRQPLQRCGDGQTEWDTSSGGGQSDVANLEENGPTWASLHLKKLQFEGSTRPAKRVCGFHAYLAIREAEAKGWIPKGSVEVPEEAWGSPTFDKKLMDVYLHDIVEYTASPGSESPPDAWSPDVTPKAGDIF